RGRAGGVEHRGREGVAGDAHLVAVREVTDVTHAHVVVERLADPGAVGLRRGQDDRAVGRGDRRDVGTAAGTDALRRGDRDVVVDDRRHRGGERARDPYGERHRWAAAGRYGQP